MLGKKKERKKRRDSQEGEFATTRGFSCPAQPEKSPLVRRAMWPEGLLRL